MEEIIDTKQIEVWQTFLMTEGTAWLIKILAALAIFVIGKWVVKRVANIVNKAMVRGNIDATLASFLSNLINILLLAFVIIAALSKIGIETASLAAIFAAAGLAIGLSMQSSLSNLAAGIMIIFFRPFKVGDFIEAGGTSGTVEEVNIFTTKFKNPNNVQSIVPNGSIINGVITNYSSKDTRRMDLTFGIGYGDNIKLAKDIIHDVIASDSRILSDPAPQIVVKNLGESSVDFAVRPWAKSEDFWNAQFDLIENIKLRFDEAGITIPFPQRDVNVIYHNSDNNEQKGSI